MHANVFECETLYKEIIIYFIGKFYYVLFKWLKCQGAYESYF